MGKSFFEKLKADGKAAVIIDGGQIVGKIISMEERNGELYAKVEIPDKSEKELNDRLYPKFSISSGKVFDFDTVELPKFNYDTYELGEYHER
jgi:hypothetical protein